jgi:hypothetical protein
VFVTDGRIARVAKLLPQQVRLKPKPWRGDQTDLKGNAEG